MDINEIASWLTIVQIGGIIAASLLGIVASRILWKAKWRRHKYSKAYFPTDLIDFYTHFCKEIRRAKKLIRIVGDGFTISNPASLRNSNTLDAAFVDALEKGVLVERFQISSTAPLSWFSRLYAIKERYPDTFRIFMNPDYDGIGSFCVIDPGTRKAVLESQTTTGVITGRGTEPVFFSFIYGHQSKTDRANNLFIQATKGERAIELTLENIPEIQKAEWTRRIRAAREDPQSSVLDPEIIQALKQDSGQAIEFPHEKFLSKSYVALDFTDHWGV